MQKWVTRIKVLVLSGLFAAIGNWINTSITQARAADPSKVIVYMPWDVFPALIFMVVIILVGMVLQEAIAKAGVKLPNILYISAIAIILSIPNFSPAAAFMKAEFGKIGLLPLCTPILAYAGISIGKDLDDFKKQGVAIVCVALLTFFGTFVGSAIIAQIILAATGQI
jgi:hypothetical protein